MAFEFCQVKSMIEINETRLKPGKKSGDGGFYREGAR
jgi:hypothetical protein